MKLGDGEVEKLLIQLLEDLFSLTFKLVGVPVYYGIRPHDAKNVVTISPAEVVIPFYIPQGYLQQIKRVLPEIKNQVLRFFPDQEVEISLTPPVLKIKQKKISPVKLRFRFNQERPFHAVIGLEPDTRKMPVIPFQHPEYSHVLVAGTTGSGKTNTLWALLLSLMYNTPPSDLRLVLCDPKYTGLEPFTNLPHTEVFAHKGEEIAKVLIQVKEELLARIPTRRTSPHILVVIEELAELTSSPVYGRILKDEVLPTIGRMGREFNVRLLVTTQRPTLAVVGEQLRQQFGIRFIGRLESDREASWLVEDKSISAKRLPGQGMMLYKVGAQEYRLLQVAKIKDLSSLVDEIQMVHGSKGPRESSLLPALPLLAPEKVEETVVAGTLDQKLRGQIREGLSRWASDGQLVVSLTSICEELGVNVKNRAKRNQVKQYLEEELTHE